MAFFLAIHFVTPFSTQTWSWKNRWSFVKDFVASTPVWRNFNKNLDENSTILFWQKFVAKRGNISSKRERGYFALWQNVLPQKKVLLSSKISLLQLELQRNSDERICGKILRQNVLPQSTRRKSNEILTKGKWRNQREKSFYQNILQVLRYYGGVQTQYIYIYIIVSWV